MKKEDNGTTTQFMEQSNIIPVFDQYYCSGEVVKSLDDYENPLIFLSDEPLVKSNPICIEHKRNNLLTADWNSKSLQHIVCDDNLHNRSHVFLYRSHVFLDRYPKKQHTFIGLAQRQNLYDSKK